MANGNPRNTRATHCTKIWAPSFNIVSTNLTQYTGIKRMHPGSKQIAGAAIATPACRHAERNDV